MMNAPVYPITGGDYEGGGAASKQLKDVLKKVGVDAQTIRRVMIAAYEAEMNTVIHARKGLMRFAVDPEQVEVAIDDEGPGIPNVDEAMREGFSTAPAAARELGFGAGMGLPNIKRNADRFSIQSRVGEGTQIRFRIFLKPPDSASLAVNSVHIVHERCRHCLECLHACPTEAIRVRETGPQILAHLCVDCTSCMAVCAPHALTIDVLTNVPESWERQSPDWHPQPPAKAGTPNVTEEAVLVVPAPLLEQFGPDFGPGRAWGILQAMGFEQIRLDYEWEQALREAVAAYVAQASSPARPVVSPLCPAVVNLIRTRYPSLIGHIAPFLTPIEAACEELTAPLAVFVGVCPSQHTVLRAARPLTRTDIVSAAALGGAILSRSGASGACGRDGQNGQSGHEASALPGNANRSGDFPEIAGLPIGIFVASGMPHVVRVLDEVENGLMRDYAVLELFACPEGCFGSPVWTEDAFVARQRYERARAWYEDTAREPSGGKRARAIRRTDRLDARGGVRLDTNMAKAIEKLARIDTLTKRLPGRNCGVCGAPSCAAHAEDVVLGRAEIEACAYVEEASSLFEREKNT